jgi:hypothetical protein
VEVSKKSDWRQTGRGLRTGSDIGAHRSGSVLDEDEVADREGPSEERQRDHMRVEIRGRGQQTRTYARVGESDGWLARAARANGSSGNMLEEEARLRARSVWTSSFDDSAWRSSR